MYKHVFLTRWLIVSMLSSLLCLVKAEREKNYWINYCLSENKLKIIIFLISEQHRVLCGSPKDQILDLVTKPYLKVQLKVTLESAINISSEFIMAGWPHLPLSTACLY